MSDFPIVKTNAVDNVTDVLAKHINNLEDKVGIDNDPATTSLDFITKHHIPNILKNGNFINNTTNGYGGTPEDWVNSTANPVQGGFPSMTKAELIALLGIEDGNIEGLWNLNEANGNGVDLSSNGYDLVDRNTVTSTDDGLMGKARTFLAANTEYMDNAAANCNITGSQTFFAFIKPTALGGTIMGFRNATTADDFKALAFTGASGPTIDWNLEGLTTNSVVTSDISLETEKWYFICGVYDSANTKLKLWINGVKKEVTASGSADSNSQNFSIGRGGAFAGGYISASIQNAGVLSVALSDSQIKRLFAYTLYKGLKIRFVSGTAFMYQESDESLIRLMAGKTLTLRAKMWQETASTGTISLYDGVASQESATSTTTGAWVDVSVSMTVNANPTSIRAYLTAKTSAANVWFKEVALYESPVSLPFYHSYDDWLRFRRMIEIENGDYVKGYRVEGSLTYYPGALTTTMLSKDGELGYDTTNNRLYIRQAGAVKYCAMT